MKQVLEKYMGVILFYLVIIGMILLVNVRYNYLNSTLDNVTYAYNN